jgi:hypothetical protein
MHSTPLHTGIVREAFPRFRSGQTHLAPAPLPFEGFLKLAILAIVLLFIVDATMAQLQMLFLGGRTFITLAPFKILVSLIIGLFVIRHSCIPSPLVTNALLLFGTYLALDVLYLLFGLHITIFEILVGYWVYYSPLFIVLLLMMTKVRFSDRWLVKVLFFTFLVIAPLALAQWVANDPIVPTRSLDGSFKIIDYDFIDHDRAFSLFTFPGMLGIFASFIGILALSLDLKKVNLFVMLSLYASAAYICYITIVRSDYIAFICGSLAVWLLKKKLKSPMVFFAPMISLLGAAVILANNLLSGLVSSGGIQDASSFFTRVLEWQYYLDLEFHASITDLLFGKGLVQTDQKGLSQVLPVDNIYLQYPLHIGLLGLGLLIFVYIAIWIDLVRRVRQGRSVVITSVAALWSTLPGLGMFSVPGVTLSLYLLFAYMVEPSEDAFSERSSMLRIAQRP